MSHSEIARFWPAVPLCLALLVVVRALQAWTFGPVFHQGEWLEFARLALDLREGSGLASPAEYSYMAFSQGVLVVQLLTAALALVFTNLTTALFASSILLELLGLAALLELGRRLGAKPWIATALWVFAPSFVVIWHLLPYGNHAAFWSIPSAFCLLQLTGRQDRGRGWYLAVLVLATVGLLAYRPLGAVAVAFALGEGLGGRRWRPGAAALAGVAVGLVIAVAGFGQGDPEAGSTITARLRLGLADFDPARAWMVHQFAAPRENGVGHLYRAVLLCAVPATLWLAWTRRAAEKGETPLLLFVGLFAGIATFAPLVSENAWPEYSLLGFFGRTLALLVVLWLGTGRARLAALAGTCLLVVTGIPDGLALIRPAAWSQWTGYDGVQLRAVLPTDHLDPDDLPFVVDLTTRLNHHGGASFVLDDPRSTCGWRSWRWPNGNLVDPLVGSCHGWPSGTLADEVQLRIARGEQLDLDIVGRLAWIAADRDISQVIEAVEGAPREVLDAILVGANAEKAYWAGRE